MATTTPGTTSHVGSGGEWSSVLCGWIYMCIQFLYLLPPSLVPSQPTQLFVCMRESLQVRLIPPHSRLLGIEDFSNPGLVSLALSKPCLCSLYTRRGQRGPTLYSSSIGRCEVVAHTTSRHHPGEAHLLSIPSYKRATVTECVILGCSVPRRPLVTQPK